MWFLAHVYSHMHLGGWMVCACVCPFIPFNLRPWSAHAVQRARSVQEFTRRSRRFDTT